MKKDSKGNETNLVYSVSSKLRAQHHTSFAVWFQFLDMSCFLQAKNFKHWEEILILIIDNRISDRVSRMGGPGLGLMHWYFSHACCMQRRIWTPLANFIQIANTACLVTATGCQKRFCTVLFVKISVAQSISKSGSTPSMASGTWIKTKSSHSRCLL